MKDFVLSLLSRGYGQIVPDEGGHDGRLEVCFEPEDYFNWKSKPPLLHLTSSGQFLGGVEPVPPKTYSTRRGPLILYSEDLALSCQTSQVNRKRKAPSDSDHHLHTLQDLARAILAYGKKQSKAGSLADGTHPLIPDTKHASQHIHMQQRTEENPYHVGQSKEKAGHIRYQPRFLCSPRNNKATLGRLPPITKGLVHIIQSQEKTHLAPVSAEKDEQVRHEPRFLHSPWPNRTTLEPLPPITEGLVHIQSQEKTNQESDEQMFFKTKDQLKPKVKKRHRTEADTCRTPMSPIPETTAAQTQPADQTILSHLTDHPKDPNGCEKHSLMENRSGVGEMCTLRSVYLDSSLDCSPLSRLNYYGGHMEGFRQIRHCGGETSLKRVTTETHPSITITHLPPINHSPPPSSASSEHLIDFSTLTSHKPKTNNMWSCENRPQRQLKVDLPDITLGPTQVNQSDRTVHRKVLVLLPPQSEITETPLLHDELHATENCTEDSKPCGTMELTEKPSQRGQDPLSDSRCRIIEMDMDLAHVVWSDNLEKRDKNPPLGPLPPLVGRRGPGKQSSMAVYSQSPHDPADTEDTQTGNIRGCLPPELRERQAGEAAGTVIMGPDGEIIRLSLWDPAVDTEDHPIMGDVTHSHVLKVVTSEEHLKQPWTILIQDYAADKGDVTIHNTEATATKKKQIDTNHEVFMVNKPAQPTNAKRGKNHSGSHNRIVKTVVSHLAHSLTDNAHTKTNAEEEQEEDEDEEQEEVEEELEEDEEEDEEEEDYLGSDSEVNDQAQVFLVYAHAKQNTAEDDETHFVSDIAIIQETKVRSRVKQTNAKRKKTHLGADTEIIQEAQVNSHGKQTNDKRNEDCLGSDDEVIQEGEVLRSNSHVKRTNTKRKVHLASDNEINQKEEVYLPEERLKELSSTTHQPGRRGEGITAVQRNRKGKTTTLQPETGVTLGSRKSKGATPAINPKSTQFTPSTYTSGQSPSPHGQAEIQTGLPVESAFDGKGQFENTGGTDDVEHKPLENVKKNKKINKQASKSKRKTVQINKDDEIQNSRAFDETTAISKQKKSKEMTEKEKVERKLPEEESHKSKTKGKKKKKGQPAFVVGKPRPQEVEWKETEVDETYESNERETYDTNKRETYNSNEREKYATSERETYATSERGTYKTYEKEMPTYNTEDGKLNNNVSQQHHYIDSGDDMDADIDSDSTDTHEAHDSPRSVYSTHRSHYSQLTALSHPSVHRLSQSSHRTTSMGVAASCSPAALSLINIPPLTAQHPASDPNKSESGNNVKSSEEPHPKKQFDTKDAALAERAEWRRLEVERKRREKEEEKKRQQEKEETEERMRMELEEEQKKRAEEMRLRKMKEEEERRRRQEEEMGRQRREQAEKERERRRQEEKRRLLERFQKERQEGEKRQAAELEHKRLEEEAQKEEERIRLSEMEETERLEYLRRRQEEEEERRKAAEERKKRDEEAAMRVLEEARLQAEMFARQREALEQHLKFHRSLFVEAGGLEQTQDVSRPWVFSYFALLKLLGLESTSADEDALTDVL